MKVYDYTEAAFHVKQVRLILNGDKVKLMGARAEYNSVEDLLNVKAFESFKTIFSIITTSESIMQLYFQHYSKTELPFKPRTVLTNVCLLTRCNSNRISLAIFRYLIMTSSSFRAQHPAMRGIRDLFHWMSSEEEIEAHPAHSFAASRMTPSGLVYR